MTDSGGIGGADPEFGGTEPATDRVADAATDRVADEARVRGRGARAADDADEPASEAEAWAVVLSADGLGPTGFAALLGAFGTGRAILAAAGRSGAAARFARIAAEGDGRPPFGAAVGQKVVEAAATVADCLAVLRASGLRVLTLDDADYPERLRAIELPPPLLYVRGEADALSGQRAVAIVGTRRPTEQGRLLAARIAAVVSAAGAVVVSGLAVGIDGAAHAAVRAEGRPTVAVLGSGHGRLYPLAHGRLAREIVANGGAIVSEFWPDHPPSRGTFPRRNRVISGLADATIVVEAGLTSGALITAKWALEQGRGLFLAPGPIGEPRAAGCLRWLREFPGEARIIATIPGLIEDLGLLDEDVAAEQADDGSVSMERRPTSRPRVEAVLFELGPAAGQVGAALVAGHGSLDELVAVTGLEPATVLGTITLLELRGLASSTYGRYRATGQLAAAPPEAIRRLPVRAGPC